MSRFSISFLLALLCPLLVHADWEPFPKGTLCYMQGNGYVVSYLHDSTAIDSNGLAWHRFAGSTNGHALPCLSSVVAQHPWLNPPARPMHSSNTTAWYMNASPVQPFHYQSTIGTTFTWAHLGTSVVNFVEFEHIDTRLDSALGIVDSVKV